MRIAAALVAVGVGLVAAACGRSPATTPTVPTQVSSALAFARCMRSHGVPSFPDPDAQGGFPEFHAVVSKQVSSAANAVCTRHLVPRSGNATPEQERQKLQFGLKVAQCMRSHGFPSMPDPTRLGSNALPSGIDPSSPTFQAAESTCEQQSRKALGLP